MLRANQKLQLGWILGAACASFAATGCSSGTNDTGSSSTSSSSGVSTTTGGSSTTSASSGATTGPGDGGVSDATMDANTGPSLLWTFDTDNQDWQVVTSQTHADASGYNPGDLGAMVATNFGQDNNGGHPSTPTGELTFHVPFSAYNQQVGIEVMNNAASWPANLPDLSTQVLSLWMKVDANPDGGPVFNTDPNCPGGFVFYFKSGATYAWAQASWANINETNYQWTEYTFDVKNKLDKVDSRLDAGYDPTNVDSIGFLVATGGGNVSDGGPSACAPPSPATIHVDSIGIQPAK